MATQPTITNFRDAVVAGAPALLGLGAQIRGANPNGLQQGLGLMLQQQEQQKRKAAIGGLMDRMGIAPERRGLLDTLPVEQQQMAMLQMMDTQDTRAYERQQQAESTAAFNEYLGGTVSSAEVDAGKRLVQNGQLAPMDFARTMLGKGEVPNRQEIQKYLETGGAGMDPATVAWCAAFVNSSLAQAGIQGTGKMNARSFLDWGQPVDQPQPGDIAVFSRGDPNGWQGHVGFFDGQNEDGTIRVLGGNQGDAVSVANYPAERLLGYRRATPSLKLSPERVAQALADPRLTDAQRSAIKFQYEQQQDKPADEYERYRRDELAAGREPMGRLDFKKAIAEAGRTTVNVGDNYGPGDRPLTDKPPKGYQRRFDEERGTWVDEPIPGSADAREVSGDKRKLELAMTDYESNFAAIDKALTESIQTVEDKGRMVAGVGSFLSVLPESAARDFQSKIDFVKANLGFEVLQRMREASPTGGALGNVTERELAFLQAAQGNLDAAQSPEQLQQVLREIQQRRREFREERNRVMRGDQPQQGNRLRYNPQTGVFE